jgi:hypothetical protein
VVVWDEGSEPEDESCRTKTATRSTEGQPSEGQAGRQTLTRGDFIVYIDAHRNAARILPSSPTTPAWLPQAVESASAVTHIRTLSLPNLQRSHSDAITDQACVTRKKHRSKISFRLQSTSIQYGNTNFK